jgi:prevent-host-death family protein
VAAVKKNYIGIREARINLSKLIRDVRSGMEIVITDRGKPVARLVPAQGQTLSLEERIKNYESCGLIESSSSRVKDSSSPIELPRDLARRYLGEGSEND